MTEYTPGPWNWTIHDSSAATLHGADDMLDHILTVSPCKHCRGEEWQWGACTNPTKANAEFIIKAVNSHDAMVRALEQIANSAIPVHRKNFLYLRGIAQAALDAVGLGK